MKKREIRFRVLVNRQISINDFTIWEFWDREVELEFKNWDTLPFWDIDRNEDRVKYLQYTWMKDKNWIRIFEWDIVKYTAHAEPWKQEFVEFINPVFWEEDFAQFSLWDVHCFWALATDENKEVIGNIYSNPKLIKKKQNA